LGMCVYCINYSPDAINTHTQDSSPDTINTHTQDSSPDTINTHRQYSSISSSIALDLKK
jgi:hypothetical protein